MTTRRIVLRHALNFAVTTLPASTPAPALPAWQQTHHELIAEVIRLAHIPGEPPVTRDEAWYLLRVPPHGWQAWLILHRLHDGGQAIARAIAVATPAQRLEALRELEADEAGR